MLGRANPLSPDLTLGFALQLADGTGLLSSKNRPIGLLELKILELEVPDLDSPFDITGGPDAFKTRRLNLKHLVVGLGARAISDVVQAAVDPETARGFRQLSVSLESGHLSFGGQFACQGVVTPVSFKASAFVQDQDTVALVFHDIYVHGYLPVPAMVLPQYLHEVLPVTIFKAERGTLWRCRPSEQFLRYVMPRTGWKVPDTQDAALVAVETTADQMVLIAGQDVEPAARKIMAREPSASAVYEAEQTSLWQETEAIIGQGDFAAAYQAYLEQWTQGEGGRFVEDRLLALGAAGVGHAQNAIDLATEILEREPKHVGACLTLAALAQQEEEWGDAEKYLIRASELLGNASDRHGQVGSQLAAARVAEKVDPADAQANYESTIQKDRTNVLAHQGLFRLHVRQENWEQARALGMRLTRLDLDASERAQILCELGTICRDGLQDYKQARLSFERALRTTPDYQPALLGLAETFAARGEPARAAVYLGRLAEQATRENRKEDVAQLYLRIGRLWEEQLRDTRTASEYYRRILKVYPEHRPVRFRLAQLALQDGDLEQARLYYEDILTLTEIPADDSEREDAIRANTELAKIALELDGRDQQAIDCYERILSISPGHQATLEAIGPLLWRAQRWPRLVEIQKSLLEASDDLDVRQRLHFDCAKILHDRLNEVRAARRHLEAVLDEDPTHVDALDLLSSVLQMQQDTDALQQRLNQAAQLEEDPQRQSELQAQLYDLLVDLDGQPAQKIEVLCGLLDTNPQQVDYAEALLELSRDGENLDLQLDALERRITAGATSAELADWHVEASQVCKKIRDIDGAIDHLVQATGLEPTRADAWLMMAQLQEDHVQPQQAILTFSKALEHFSQEQEPTQRFHRELARLNRHVGDDESETLHLSHIVDFGEYTDTDCMRLIELLAKLGRHAELGNRLESWALRGQLLDAESLYMRAARIWESSGQAGRSVEIYEQLVRQRGYSAYPAAMALEALATNAGDLEEVEKALLMQLEVAPPADIAQVYERLARLRIEHHSRDVAIETCRALLEHNPFSALAYDYLGKDADTSDNYMQALDYGLKYLTNNRQARAITEAELRGRYERIASLASELRPSGLEDLVAAYAKDFPGESMPMVASFGRTLREEGSFQKLLDLRLMQEQEGCYFESTPISFEIAELYHQDLGDLKEALRWYQRCNQENHDSEHGRLARDAMVDILENEKQYELLAESCWDFARHGEDVEETLRWGIQSATIFYEKLARQEKAREVIWHLLEMGDAGEHEAELLALLRKLSESRGLVTLLRTSLDKTWDVEDGRFTELVDLLANEVEEPEQAIALAERAVETFAYLDIPHRTLVTLLSVFEDFGDPAQALLNWANAREGEARLEILMDRFGILEKRGDHALATSTLEAAADCASNPAPLIEKLISRCWDQEQYDKALVWTQTLYTQLDDEGEQEACLHRIVDTALDHCAAPDVAESALEKSSQPLPILEKLVQYYLDVEDYNQALKWQRQLADGQPQGQKRYDAFVTVGEIALEHAGRPRVAEQALGELRDNTDLADKLIQYYIDSGDISRALKWLQSVVEALPEHSGTEHRLEQWVVLALDEQSDVAAAQRAVDHASRKSPLLELLLNYHLKVEDFPAALSVLENLAMVAEDETQRQVHLYRMADLAIKKAADPTAVERAIELSHAPAELIEKYISFLLAQSEYGACVNWLLRLHASAADPEVGESYVDRILNVSLDHAQDVELADQGVAVSLKPFDASERVIHFLLAHERWAEALTRLERLASVADSGPVRDACLMRLVELGLGAANDRLAAERAFDLASDPRPIIQAFLEYDESCADYIACVGHLSRLLAITTDADEREDILAQQLDFGLVQLAEPAIAEKSIQMSNRKAPLVNELVNFLLDRERYSEALSWLEKLSGLLEDGPEKEMVLRRMVELALNGGSDESAAERAIALSQEPGELVEVLVSRLQDEERFLGAIKWLEFLAQRTEDEDVRESYLARMMELSLGLAGDIASAERVIALSNSATPLVEELILYLDETDNQAAQLTWLEYLCQRADLEGARQNYADRLFKLCLKLEKPKDAERAIELAPESRPLIEALVDWYSKRGDVASAARLQEVLVRQDSDKERRGFDTHRLLDFLLDGLEDAVAAERIIEVSPEPAAFIERLVSFHQARGEYAAALRWLERLVDSVDDDVSKVTYRHRYVDLALGEAARPQDAERCVLASNLDPSLTEKFIAWYLEREEFGPALRWTEQLALAAREETNNPWLRRMFDLALGEADDMPAAQRAIGLAQSPTVMMERLVGHLLENFEFAEALRWYEELAQIASRGHVRDGYLAQMQELALSKVQDLSAAERAIQLADDKLPLIAALVAYLRDNSERDPALEWMKEQARLTEDVTSRRPLLSDLVDYALEESPRFAVVEDAIEMAERPAPLIAKYVDALAAAGEHQAVLDWLLRLADISTLEQERETCFARIVRVALHDLARADLAEELVERSAEPAPLIEELVSWYMERGEYEKALSWTWRLVDAAVVPDERDFMRRRVVELALGLADDRDQGIKALAQLESPEKSELGELAELYLEAGSYDQLYRILPELNGVEPELLLKAARHHLVQGELDRARFYMQGALDRNASDTEVWAMARGPFRDAGRGLSLGQWMLEYALQVSPDSPHPLRLDAFRQMLDAKVAPETLGDPTWVAEQFNAANFKDLGQARLVYEAAVHIENKPWAYRAAAALEELLDPSDALYLDVLRTRIEFEETQYDYPAVARIARKLIALGDDSAQDILEKALGEGGESAELLTVLHTRLAKGDGESKVLLTRIARIYEKSERWADVCSTLDEFKVEDRDEHWANLAWPAGEQNRRSDLQAAAAAIKIDNVRLPSEQAMWCRREATVRWWELDEREVAEDLLRQAQLISPKSVEDWLEESRMSVPKEAVRRLYESLVSFPDESGFDLLTALVTIYQGASRNDEAVDVLTDAARRVAHDGQRLQVVAGMAAELSAVELQVQALEQAYRNDSKYFEDLDAGLTQAGLYKKLVQVLVNRAQVLELEESLEEAQQMLERAAHLAQTKLDDGEWALELLEKAAGLTKNVTDLETAFNLAFEREDLLAQERMVSSILEGTENQEKVVDYLRHLIRIQETQGLFEETAESLARLAQLGEASDEEQLRLASLILDTEPLRAAQMLEALADTREGIDAGRLYFESCYGYCAAEERSDAARVIQLAMDAGFKQRDVFEQALTLLEGQPRANALSAYLASGGNSTWDLHQNQAIRLELANLHLDYDQGQQALAAAEGGLNFGESRDLVQAKERALIQLGAGDTLSRWYLAEADRTDSVWDTPEMLERIKTASKHYRAEEDFETEKRALDHLNQRGDREPEFIDRALIIARMQKDYTTYTERLPQRLSAARDGADADQLTIFFARQLAEDFDAPEAGLELVRSRLKVHPSILLADCLDELYQLLGRPEDSLDIYRYLLELQPTNQSLLVECLDRCLRYERFEDAIDLLLMRARHFEDGETAYKTAGRAAALARDHVVEYAKDVDCLELCLELKSGRVPEATTLAWRYCELERFIEAQSLLFNERLPRGDQLALALELLRLYVEHEADESVLAIQNWVVENHPESAAARQIRLDQARVTGHPERLVAEIEKALQSVDELESEDAMELHREAARIWASEHQAEKALDMLMPILAQDDVLASDLYDAGALAAYAGKEEKRKEIVGEVSKRLDEFTALAQRYEGQARSFGYSMVGEALSTQGRDAEAIEAHRESLRAATDHLPEISVDALTAAFLEDENHRGLVAIKELQYDFVEDDSDKALLGVDVARLYMDQLDDLENAETTFLQCLEWDAGCSDAMAGLGDLCFTQGRFEDSARHFDSYIRSGSDVTVEDRTRMVVALRNTGQFDKALEASVEVLEYDPDNRDAREIRVEILEARGNKVALDRELQAYEALLDDDLDNRLKFTVQSRLGQLALDNDDLATSREWFEKASKLNAQDAETMGALRGIAEREERWEDAAELGEKELEHADSGAQRREHLEHLQFIYRDKLEDAEASDSALRKAADLSPEDIGLQNRLLEHYRSSEDWENYLATAVNLMNAADPDELGTKFFTEVAQVYQDQRGDLESARLFYTKAMEYDPSNLEVKDKGRELARDTGDFKAFAEIESDLIDSVDNLEERICRAYELAYTLREKVGDGNAAKSWLERAHEMVKDDRELARDIAEKYTLETSTYPIARDVYRGILKTMARDPEVTRILARLSGQIGDVDRAYGYYSTLSAIVPSDDEARGYIVPCRRARPKVASRALKDIERMAIAPPPSGSTLVAALMNPLARQAEALQRGEMQLRGVTDRDRMEPTDKRALILTQTLESVGLSHRGIYLWRGGGFECEMALDAGPAILLGSTLAADASDGERIFLVARAAELYRKGHTLCSRLSAEGLQSILGAMAMAVDPALEPRGMRDETRRAATQIGAALLPEERQRLMSVAREYVDKATLEDVETFQLSTLKAANRVALSLSGDVEEAINALLRVAGRDSLFDDGRGALQHGSSEGRDLVDYATSEEFFELRQALGLTLPRRG